MLQGTLFEPPCSWQPPSLSSLPSWAGMQRICIDVETKDLLLRTMGIGVRRGGYIVGIGFTIEDTGQSFYLPIRHGGGGNMDEGAVLAYLRHNAALFTGQLVGANFQYDLDYLWEEGIYFPNVVFYRDIQVAEPLIDENQMSFSLYNIGQKYGIEAKDETLLRDAAAAFKIDPKKDLWRMPAKFVGAYGEGDTVSPLRILREQEKLIEKYKLWEIWNLESKVLPVLVKMRRRGVRIDLNKLAEVEAYSLREGTEALAKVFHQTGVKIDIADIMKNDVLAPALEHIGVRLRKTKTGKVNIDKDVLENIKHPVADALLWARKVAKLKTTFAASVREHMVNGRIHCTFNQIAREDDEESGDVVGARYGRLSCVKPNLQQQPSRDEFADFWRSIYTPEEGAIWGCNDYSQQEPRWTTHFAALMKLKGAEEAARRYRENPDTDNHNMMTEIVHGAEAVAAMDAKLYKKNRSECKDIYLGLCYGEGGAKLSRDLELPTRWAISVGKGRMRQIIYTDNRNDALKERAKHQTDVYMWEAAGEECQKILDKFDTNAPFVRLVAKKAEDRAKQVGEIRTVGGRVLHFTQKKNGQYDYTHKALNRLIQGSSADQVKVAMVEIDSQMPDVFLQLQVHDETDGSYGTVAEAKQVAEIMRNCITGTLVPFKVDTECGPSWGEIKKV